MTEALTATAMRIRDHETDTRIRHAFERLFYKLKKFVRAYPRLADDRMPDHDIEFVVSPEDDPRAAVLKMIETCPDVWLTTLPDDVSIVPNKVLSQLTNLDDAAIKHLSEMGMHRVFEHAYLKQNQD